MFSINIYLRFALIALGFIGGIILTALSGFGFWYAFPFWLLGIIMLGGYIMMGTVQSTSVLIQSMKFEEAEKRLDLTFKPDWLYKTYKALYYLLKGSLAMNSKDHEAAEKYLEIAQSIDLPSDDEKAMVALQLASIHANRGKWQAAQLQHRTLKNLKVKTPQLKEQISEFDKVMKNRGSIKQARGMNKGGMPLKPGGKRRRPKMR